MAIVPDDTRSYVQTKNAQYEEYEDKWKLIRDVMKGDVTEYLRNIGKTELDSTYGRQRQKEYEDGAIFYNFSKRTSDGMTGSVMRKDAQINIPASIQYLIEDADGNGQPLEQQANRVVRECIEVGRGGLFVDVPSQNFESVSTINGTNLSNDYVVSLQDQADGKINPKIQYYPAESIINWRTQRFGSVNRLVLIVLKEEYEYQSGENEFMYLVGEQYRVLDIGPDGFYRQRVYRFSQAGEQTSYDEVEPVSNGNKMTEIPFTFVGAENNDYSVDEPPLFPLCTLNIGHYRNSADNEEFLHILGQAMLTVSPSNAIAAKWKEQNPQGIKFGAREGINLGEGGRAEILQAQPNTANYEAMRAKEEQAVQIGAQLITPSLQETAEAARIKNGADTSVLASISENVSAAYVKAIGWCLMFLNDSSSDYEFVLNKDFFFDKLSAQDRQQWVADIQAGILPWSSYTAEMRRTGQVNPDLTDEELSQQISEGQEMLNLSDGTLDLGV